MELAYKTNFEYKIVTIGDLLDGKYDGDLHGEKASALSVQVGGVVRGVSVGDSRVDGPFEEIHSINTYRFITAYLQDSDREEFLFLKAFFPTQSSPSKLESAISLLKTSSELDLEVTIRGIYVTGRGEFPSIEAHYLQLRNMEVNHGFGTNFPDGAGLIIPKSA